MVYSTLAYEERDRMREETVIERREHVHLCNVHIKVVYTRTHDLFLADLEFLYLPCDNAVYETGMVIGVR